MKAIANRFKTNIYLTATQDVLISDIKSNEKSELERFLSEYGIPQPDSLSLIQKNSMACPALPTCGLAITESERTLPALVDQLEKILNELGLGNERITLRMTGCPNGCARPYSSEIGLVGRAVGTYNIYLGGNLDGTRLNQLFSENVPEGNILSTLQLVFKQFKLNRKPGEAFGNFCYQIGMDQLRQLKS